MLLTAAAISVLFFTKSSGHEHSVIKVIDGQPSLAMKVLGQIGEPRGFQITHTKDGAVFTKDQLAKYDLFVFYTSGDLTELGRQTDPPMPAGGKEALLAAIEGGKGFVGIHAAADTFHTTEDRFVADGDKTDPYLKMLGGEFIRHGPQQVARLQCSDAKFPGMAAQCAPLDLHEEWYSYKNLATDLHVIQWLETWSLKNTAGGSVYRRPPYPVTWVRRHGKGRVFYTALGHREDVWERPSFQEMLAGGLLWAARRIDTDATPNIATVTPGYAELPPNDPTPTPAARPTPVPAP